eukprot:6203301-Pleurochrysis_carterae.AAC.6
MVLARRNATSLTIISLVLDHSSELKTGPVPQVQPQCVDERSSGLTPCCFGPAPIWSLTRFTWPPHGIREWLAGTAWRKSRKSYRGPAMQLSENGESVKESRACWAAASEVSCVHARPGRPQ